MKALKYIAAVAIVGLVACQNNDVELEGYNADPNAVQISATIGDMLTRSFPTEEIGEEKATQFKVGDRISVSTDDQSAVVYVLEADNSWKPVDPNAYLVWNKSEHTFTAHYPAGEYTGYEPTRVIQDSEEDIAKADYMSFSGEFSNTGTVSFEMNRRTARLVIDEAQFSWGNQYMESNNAIYEVKEIKIHAGDAGGISPYKVGRKYYALVNPGAEKADAPFITLRVGPKQGYSGTEEELIIRGIPELTAGTSYNFYLTIGKNKAELGKVTVEDWSTSENPWSGTASDGYVVYETYDGYTAYDIHTLEGLLEVNQILTAPDVTEEMLRAHITLYADFELPVPAPGESNWTTIGTDEYKPFRGHFDGNGHSITGLVVNSNAPYQGLLGYATNKVSNLTLIGCTVKGDGYVGGIAGFTYGEFSNCKVIATEDYPVVIESTNEYVGGMIGRNDFGEISNCSVIADGGSVTIKSTGNSLGGFVGGNGSGIISNCHVKTVNNGIISITGSSESQNTGGFVGYNHYSNASISGCSVNNENGTISITNSDNANTGGFVGRNEQTISNCNVTGATITGKINVGGFAGLIYEYDATITGTNRVRNCIITGNDGTTNSNYGKLEEIYKTINIDADDSNTVIYN